MHKILILGKSGTGKTSSLRNLDPKETIIINPDKKSLPLENWRKNYVTIKKEDGTTDLTKSNYFEVSKSAHILKILEASKNNDKIKTIVLDTITHLITSTYMTETIGKDFKAYQSLGLAIYQILDVIRDYPKTIIITAHIDDAFNDMGQRQIDVKSYGKMIKDMEIPSFFTTVLITDVLIKDSNREYVFRTQSLGNDPVKSPVIFKENNEIVTALPFNIPNDIKYVIKELNKFEGIN
jgi:hypothetical protein